MKKWLTLLLVMLLLLTCAAAEPYSDVAKHYLTTYGKWWDYSPELWLEYAAAVRAADPGNSHAARAIAATEYILPPAGALTEAQAKEIAINAVDASLQARPLAPCFLLDDRAVYKVILYAPDGESSVSHTVELDAHTGEVLGVYARLTVDVGCFFTPNAVWAAVSLNYTPEELDQMTWSQLADLYIDRYGAWWDWNSVRWGEFVTAVKQADVSNSRTGRAVAATEYILPTHEMLLEEAAAERAIAAVGGEGGADKLVICCMAEDRAIYKVTVHAEDTVFSVEVDAYTGEVLGVYPKTSEGVGQFFVPHAVWEATPETAPNG